MFRCNKMKIAKKTDSKLHVIVFVILLIIMSFFYKYQTIISYRPQSVHAWRQADCATQVLNYAQKDMNIAKPQMHALVSDGFTEGYCVAEAPIIFYFSAIFYKIFGNNEIIYRIINTLLFFLGLFYLYKKYSYILRDNQWAIMLSLMLFASPLFVYYGNNFISNVSALSFTIVAWFFFFVYVRKQKEKHFALSILFFTISGLLKLSEFISLFTVIGIYFLELFNIVSFFPKEKGRQVFQKKTQNGLLFIVPILAVFIFHYIYAANYNELHQQKYYFYTASSNIFFLDSATIDKVWAQIKYYWIGIYYHKTVLILLPLLLLFSIAKARKVNPLLFTITIISFGGSIAYLLLFFQYLNDHDYYTISVYISFIFIFITFFDILRNHYNKWFKSYILKAVFFIFLGFNMFYSARKIDERYNGWQNAEKVYYQALWDIEPYLEKIGIKPTDKVISIPDSSPNITLYLMNRFGWTNFIEGNYLKLINLGIERGADYLIINRPELLEKEELKPYLLKKVGEKQNISIYKLK